MGQKKGKPDKGKCRGCGQEIQWRYRDGKPHPYDADGSSHFSTCPKAAQFRKGGGDALRSVTLRQVADAVSLLKSKGYLLPGLYEMSIGQIIEDAKPKQENIDGVSQ